MARPPLSEDEIAARQQVPYNGSARRSRAKATPSGTFAGKPRMPEYLSDVAKAKWKEMVKYLSQRGVLTPGDGPQLEILCTVWARWRQLVEEVERDGPIIDCPVTDNAGNVHVTRKESPAAKMAGKLETQLRQLLKELTLTVASRERGKKVKAKEEPNRKPAWLQDDAEDNQ